MEDIDSSVQWRPRSDGSCGSFRSRSALLAIIHVDFTFFFFYFINKFSKLPVINMQMGRSKLKPLPVTVLSYLLSCYNLLALSSHSWFFQWEFLPPWVELASKLYPHRDWRLALDWPEIVWWYFPVYSWFKYQYKTLKYRTKEHVCVNTMHMIYYIFFFKLSVRPFNSNQKTLYCKETNQLLSTKLSILLL